MFERFTGEARRSLFFARYRTTERHGDEISDEDLLHGISLADPAAIELMGENAATFRSAQSVEQYWIRIQRDSETAIRAQKEIPFTPDAWAAIQFAIEEADSLGHPDVGAEHLLLALLRDDTTQVYKRLDEAGVRLDDLRMRVKAQREGGPTA